MHRVLLTVAALLAAHAHAHASLAESELRESHVQHAVQLSLLHLFGFKSRPRPRRDATTPTHVPPTMFQLYRRQRRLAATGIHFVRRDSNTANTVRSFTHPESPDDNLYSDPHRFRYRFNLTGIPTSEEPRAAEIRLYREALTSSEGGDRQQRVHVFDVVRPSSRHGDDDDDDAVLRLLDTRVVDVHQSGWESFDVMPVIHRWRRDPTQNHGLVVHVTNANGGAADGGEHVRLRRGAKTTDNTWLSIQPVLLVFTDDGRTSTSEGRQRTRRGAGYPHTRTGKRNNCRRRPLYVDFSDVGWNDWIVAPPGYQAYYCQGECPFPLAEHMNATNHAIVQTLVNSVKPKAVPRACCVPTELTPISMLYLDEQDKVVLKNYQDMVVEGCGCR